MKITAVILLATCLQAAAAGYGQKVTISEKDAPVEKIFSLIRKQTGFQFLYANQVLAQARKVTIQVKNAELEDVLATTFQGQPFEYHIKDKTIIVRMRARPASVSAGDTPQPPIDVRGRIVNASGEPVAGATVMVQGTKKSTVTNANGEFELPNVNENIILEISHVQYNRELIPLNGKSMVNVVMALRVGELDETVVIAYGTTTKRFGTGNVTSVKAKDIETQPVNNPLLALQGRVPGLFVSQTSGVPGAGVSVRVQGQNSILNGNDPLYVIDGVPYVSQLLSTSFGGILGGSGSGGSNGNPMSFINPSDIESIEVLKDADATAIYGSRAANGAILISTKKGKAGQTKVDINLQSGWGKVTRKVDLLNTEQYVEMRQEAIKNTGLTISPTDYDINGTWDMDRNIDWQKELIGNTARYTNLSASVSGGTSAAQYLISGTYHKETTVFPGDFDDHKAAVHFNVNTASANQKFRVQFSGNYLVDNNQLPSSDLTPVSILLAPNAPALYNEDGSINWAPTASGISTWTNPIATYTYQTYRNRTNNLISNAILSYQLIPGLELKSSFGYTYMQSKEFAPFPLISNKPETRATTSRAAQYADNNINSWIIEPQLTYKKQFGHIKIEALAGSTIQQNKSNGQQLTGVNYNSDGVLEDIRSAGSIIPISSLATTYKYNAVFGRINFIWKDRYIADVIGRRDGSSRFGEKNQFHNFGSAALAWIFTQESVFKDLPFISFGKLRGSYGTTGNDLIGDYRFMNLYSPYTTNVGVPYQNTSGLTPTGLPNPYLQWEETRKLQAGIELGFLKDRILLTANYVHNRSSNQLLNYALPITTGFTSIFENFPATVQNTAWEFLLNTNNVNTRDFSWRSSINLTIPENKLVSFSNLELSSYATSLIIGEPVSIKKVYQLSGVDPATGLYQFINVNGGVTNTPGFSTDRIAFVNPSPEFYGGFQNTFLYKNFQLDFLFQFVKQLGPNFVFGNTVPGTFNTNQPTTVLDRWQKPNDEVTIQKYNSNLSLFTSNNNARSSNAAWSDASFIRLKNISLSWQLPKSWKERIHMKDVRLYTQGQNLLTITDYKGLDPETQSTIALPPLRMITVGLQLAL